MSQKIAVSKAGINVLAATNPNDFIFHSDYNTFKIVITGIATFTGVTSGVYTKTIAHGLGYTPVVEQFLMTDSNPEVIKSGYQEFYTAPYNDMLFYEARVDATNVIFYGRSFMTGSRDLHFRYYVFETTT